MTIFGSASAVVAAIEEDARVDVEKIGRDRDAEIVRLREEAARRPVSVPHGEARVAAARRQARERIASEDWQDRAAALSARESWIERVAAEGQRRLRARPADEQRLDIDRFAAEALERVAGDARTLTFVDGGCRVSTADGRIAYENTYETRARRLAPVWRAALGELFEEAVAAVVREEAAG